MMIAVEIARRHIGEIRCGENGNRRLECAVTIAQEQLDTRAIHKNEVEVAAAIEIAREAKVGGHCTNDSARLESTIAVAEEQLQAGVSFHDKIKVAVVIKISGNQVPSGAVQR